MKIPIKPTSIYHQHTAFINKNKDEYMDINSTNTKSVSLHYHWWRDMQTKGSVDSKRHVHQCQLLVWRLCCLIVNRCSIREHRGGEFVACVLRWGDGVTFVGTTQWIGHARATHAHATSTCLSVSLSLRCTPYRLLGWKHLHALVPTDASVAPGWCPGREGGVGGGVKFRERGGGRGGRGG